MTDIIREHARLIILRDLAEQPDRRWNSEALREDLELRWAINRPREWVHDELRWLETMGAVTIIERSSVLIASLTTKGLDHVERRMIITGVKRPSPEA
ncbi:hypothetical protein LG047_12630 [Methylocystis sp. WRRC1]|uniref:VpaChn25_0724 family phage protein n=1 Tax=unclassified Methylocystis TaxID=2625913 RepID=UPI000685630E|nr:MULTISPECIES: hypothetical protein [unclassified Methylocystis]MCC3246155.1 hypothetical protein [Methylocystis sp. WRRC1]